MAAIDVKNVSNLIGLGQHSRRPENRATLIPKSRRNDYRGCKDTKTGLTYQKVEYTRCERIKLCGYISEFCSQAQPHGGESSKVLSKVSYPVE